MPLPLLYDRTMTFSRTCTQKRIYVRCVMLCLSTTPAGLTKLRIATIQNAISALLCCADYAASLHTHTGRLTDSTVKRTCETTPTVATAITHNTSAPHVPHTAHKEHIMLPHSLKHSTRPIAHKTQPVHRTQRTPQLIVQTHTHTHTGTHVHHAQTNESN